MRRGLLLLVSLFLIAGISAAALLGWGYAQFARPGPLSAPVMVVIPKGTGLAGIAGQLHRAGIIDYPIVFQGAARLTRADKHLKAGEYAFTPGMSLREVIALLQSGKTVVRRLTVVEGTTAAQVLDLLQTTEGLEGEIGDRPDEGSLLPETYHFSYGDSRDEMLGRMSGAMKALLADSWPRRAADLPYDTPRDAVTLASVVEKETGKPGERALIAGVFANRLRRGMPLQSDPTVLYALTGGEDKLDRRLTRADLATDSPYNTYKHRGLPPGPICNPGRDALIAALNPAVTDNLYFVADGDGGHFFARTLQEHNRNVARFRKIQRERGLR